jgi:beta-phosphoglucomutase-like phosphatase (HAD superfamily)
VNEEWRWADGPQAPGVAVVFDIDGVISDATARLHHIQGKRKQWEAFFQAAADDPLIAEVARLVELLDPRIQIVLLTGRPKHIEDLTVAWLEAKELRWDVLVMREEGDRRPAPDMKRSAVDDLKRAGFDLRLAFEDDARNVAMFHREGVPCIHVQGYGGDPTR